MYDPTTCFSHRLHDRVDSSRVCRCMALASICSNRKPKFHEDPAPKRRIDAHRESRLYARSKHSPQARLHVSNTLPRNCCFVTCSDRRYAIAKPFQQICRSLLPCPAHAPPNENAPSVIWTTERTHTSGGLVPQPSFSTIMRQDRCATKRLDMHSRGAQCAACEAGSACTLTLDGLSCVLRACTLQHSQRS